MRIVSTNLCADQFLIALADKSQIARMVQALIGLRSLPRADATDALAVAITHGRRLRPIAAKIVPAVVRP